jgi:hypothetical protein
MAHALESTISLNVLLTSSKHFCCTPFPDGRHRDMDRKYRSKVALVIINVNEEYDRALCPVGCLLGGVV